MALENLPRPVLTDPRKTAVEVHAHLRQLIIDSALPPGTVLKQTELARAFHVSRTPLREAFRMLQEEGLIDADVNQRGRVRGLDPDELDHLYGGRIALESLGVRISTGRLTEDEVRQALSCLDAMDAAHTRADQAEWLRVHRQFHGLCMARAGDPLLRTINSYSERSERYLRLYQLWHPQSFAGAHDEHIAILQAVRANDPARAGSLMAEHLAHTALTVLADVSPQAAGTGVRQAVMMVNGGRTLSKARAS
jgi:DNA-binding GntR family transcriptional regulator